MPIYHHTVLIQAFKSATQDSAVKHFRINKYHTKSAHAIVLLYDRLICRPVNQGTCIVKIEQLLCERNF
jgi:hypothetical protein